MRNFFGSPAFLRFLIVGGFNTAFGYGIYALLIFIGLGYLLASTFSFAISLFFNFKTHGKFVFHDRPNRSFYSYVFSWLVVYLVNACFLVLLVNLGVDSYIAGALLILPISIFAFLIMRYVAFRVDVPTKSQ